jgi:hypothetical protein
MTLRAVLERAVEAFDSGAAVLGRFPPGSPAFKARERMLASRKEIRAYLAELTPVQSASESQMLRAVAAQSRAVTEDLKKTAEENGIGKQE